jgi:hypothetical protein
MRLVHCSKLRLVVQLLFCMEVLLRGMGQLTKPLT